jgi:hypothetical protein
MPFLTERHYLKVFVGLILGAIFLHFGFLQYTTKTVHTYSDHEVSNIAGDAIYIFDATYITAGCFASQPTSRPCLHHISHEFGIVTKYGMPLWIAALVGLFFPIVLIFCAMRMFLRVSCEARR